MHGTLRDEGVHAEDGVGIVVADQRDIRGEQEAFDAAAIYHDARCLLDFRRNAHGDVAQAGLDRHNAVFASVDQLVHRVFVRT